MAVSSLDSAWADISQTQIGSLIRQITQHSDILPGDAPSYEICKALYIAHPLGGKMTEAPIKLAQSQERELAIPGGPEEELIREFQEQWEELDCNGAILNLKTQSRMYGIATVGCISEGADPTQPLFDEGFWKRPISFNIWDPLNTSGSLTTSQNPNSPYFQKHGGIVVAGQHYHRSRTRTAYNGISIYIAWTNSAFGYVGRSVYQRAFYPLKSFLNSMITDDLVTLKAGLIIAKMKQPGVITNEYMQKMFGQKRQILKEAKTGNVLSIDVDEAIETLNMMNIDGAYGMCRSNIIKNIATAEDMPAKFLTQETFVEGFGEGTQDAYAVASFIDQVRLDMKDDYKYFDTIVQRRAWNEEEFYPRIQSRFPDKYGNRSYKDAFYTWQKDFKATWPSLIKEPDSDKVQVDDVRLKAIIAIVQVLSPLLDPDNQARVLTYFEDAINNFEHLFGGAKLVLDMDAAQAHLAELEERSKDAASLAEMENVEKPQKPFSGHDSAALVTSLVDKLNRMGNERPRHRAVLR